VRPDAKLGDRDDDVITALRLALAQNRRMTVAKIDSDADFDRIRDKVVVELDIRDEERKRPH
jgi:hypothetical protein